MISRGMGGSLSAWFVLALAGCGGGGGGNAVDAADTDTGGPADADGPTADAGGPTMGNHAPEIYSAPVTGATEGTDYFYGVLAEDVDGDPLTFSLTAAPTGMSIDAATGLITWRPPLGSMGAAGVTVHVEDPDGVSDDQAFTITVADGTAPPRITSTPILTAAAGALYSYAATADDPDDTLLTWNVTGPTGIAVSTAGVVTWTVPAGASGMHPVTLTVTDPAGHTDDQVYVIAVPVPGDTTPPTVVISTPAFGADVTQLTNVTGQVDDAALAGWRLEACQTWGTATCRTLTDGYAPVPALGLLGAIDPMLLADGTWEIRLTAQDAGGRTASTSIEVHVRGLGKMPALRLRFSDFDLRVGGVQVIVNRIYDGLNPTPGELGNGWRYEWQMGHGERPEPMQAGWDVQYISFPPHFESYALYDHPVRLVTEDGRMFDFLVNLQHDNSISSVHPVRPQFVDTGGTGATLRALDASFAAYSTTAYDLYLESGYVWEDLGFSATWEPAYWEVTTDWNERITFAAAGGEVVKYEDLGEGITIDLTSGTARINGTDMLALTYGADGMVASATDMSTGDTVAYARAPGGDLTQVTEVDGGVEMFTYATGSRLISYALPGLTPEVFEYDESGRVVRHVSGSGVVTLTDYDDAAHTITTRDVLGNTVVTHYDAQGRVLDVTDPFGYVTSFTYAPGMKHPATQTDALGKTWQYQYDAKDRRTQVSTPLGYVTQTTYDDQTGRVTSTTDGAGRVFSETLDASKRVTAYVLPDGTNGRTFSYPTPNTIVATDTFGYSTTEVRDGRGRLTSTTDSMGRVTTTTFDDVAHSYTVVDAEGRTTGGAVDRQGRVTSRNLGATGSFQYQYSTGSIADRIVTPDGQQVDYDKGAAGDVTAVKLNGTVAEEIRYDALGRVASRAGSSGAVSYRYDAAGRTIEVTDPSGRVTFAYDAAGRRAQAASDGGRLELYSYDDDNRVVGYEDGVGGALTLAWDGSGRLTSVTDAAGRNVGLTYDANGRPASVTYPGGVSVSRTYYPSDLDDEDALAATMTDVGGTTWSYQYDADYRMTAAAGPLGCSGSYGYDTQGRLTSVTDPLGGVTSLLWTEMGLASRTLAGGGQQTWTYDALSRPSTWTRADGSVVSYSYTDTASSMTLPSGGVYELEIDPAAATESDRGAPGGDVTMWRGENGHVAYVAQEDGGTVEMAYTPAKKIASITATTPGGTTFTTAYAYDAGGHLMAITDPAGGTTSMTYDLAGRTTRIDRPNGTSTELGYPDAFGRPSSVRHYRGATLDREYQYGYDTHGRVSSMTSPDGTFEYEYDALGRLSVERRLSGMTVVEEKTRGYDLAGNLRTLTTAAGTTTYDYDVDHRLLSATAPAGTTTYTYTGRGALTSIATPAGTTTMTYDDLDRLTQVVMPGGEQVSYRYDAAGRLRSRIDAAGERRCLILPETPRGQDDCAVTYSPAGSEAPAALVFGPQGFSSSHQPGEDRYTWGAMHEDVVAVTDSAGTVVGSASYDAWGARAATGVDLGYGYTGERQDPITGLVFLRARWYHPGLGRFLTVDPIGGDRKDPRTIAPYTYVVDDPLNRIDPTGRFFLVEALSVEAIQNILSRIQNTVQACISAKARKNLYKAVATWAARRAVDTVLSVLWEVIQAQIPGGSFEAALENVIGKYICGSFSGEWFEISVGPVEFYQPVTDCGDPKNKDPIDCSGWAPNLPLTQGIDIVVGKKLPIELKRDTKSFKPKFDQLVRYCRWAARHGYRVLIYGFVDFPDEPVHDEAAILCWGCWRAEANQLAGACGGGGWAGSIYVAFGLKDNKIGFYVPEPEKIGCTPKLKKD